MKCVGCLEETQSCREKMAGDSKTLNICPTSLSLPSSAKKYPLLFIEQQPDRFKSTHPEYPVKQHSNIHDNGTHASEERVGESGEAERSVEAELPESLASGPGLPHVEGEVLGTSVGAAGQ